MTKSINLVILASVIKDEKTCMYNQRKIFSDILGGKSYNFMKDDIMIKKKSLGNLPKVKSLNMKYIYMIRNFGSHKLLLLK